MAVSIQYVRIEFHGRLFNVDAKIKNNLRLLPGRTDRKRISGKSGEASVDNPAASILY